MNFYHYISIYDQNIKINMLGGRNPLVLKPQRSTRNRLSLTSEKGKPLRPSQICHYVVFTRDGRIILRWIFRKGEGVVGTGWSWLRIGTGGGHL